MYTPLILSLGMSPQSIGVDGGLQTYSVYTITTYGKDKWNKRNKKNQYNKTKRKQSNIPHPQNSCKVPSIHRQMYTPHQHVYECSLLYFGTCASIKSGRFKIFFYFINCFLNNYFYMIIMFTNFFIIDAEFFRSTFISQVKYHTILSYSANLHTLMHSSFKNACMLIADCCQDPSHLYYNGIKIIGLWNDKHAAFTLVYIEMQYQSFFKMCKLAPSCN